MDNHERKKNEMEKHDESPCMMRNMMKNIHKCLVSGSDCSDGTMINAFYVCLPQKFQLFQLELGDNRNKAIV